MSVGRAARSLRRADRLSLRLFSAVLPWLAACLGSEAVAPEAAAVSPLPRVSAKAPAAASRELWAELASVYPEPGAREICEDVTLRFRFKGAVDLGHEGSIEVRSESRGGTVARVDIAAERYSASLGGRVVQQMRPIFFEGRDVLVYLPSGSLAAGERYSVAVGAGVFVDAQGRPLSALPFGRFTFSIRSDPPLGQKLRVAREGGDYATIRGALSAGEANRDTPLEIVIAPGIYHELVFIGHRRAITLRGEDRQRSIIDYPNNDRLQLKLGSAYRALVQIEDSRDIELTNLTLRNSTPQGGSQAEALRVERSERVALRSANFFSLQDTLQLSGTVYGRELYVEGNVDFVWGKGVAYFERSEFRMVGRAGYVLQSRSAEPPGYVFVDSIFSADAGLEGAYLARIDPARFPRSAAAFIDCAFGEHFAPAGFLAEPAGDTSGLRFLEYGSRTLSGAPRSRDGRASFSRGLSPREASLLRNKAHVLRGWSPR